MAFKGIVVLGPVRRMSEVEASFGILAGNPIDGIVVDLVTDDGVNASTFCFGTDRYVYEQFSSEMGSIKGRVAAQASRGAIEVKHGNASHVFSDSFKECKNNFIRASIQTATCPSMSGANYLSALNNLKLLGKIAKDLGFKGIFWDVEPYQPIWTYNSLPDKGTLSFSDFRILHYGFGKALGAYWQSLGISVMLTSAYDSYAGRGGADEDNDYGLWRDCLDGLLDGWGQGALPGKANKGRVILTTEVLFSDTSSSHVVRYGYNKLINNYDAFSPPINSAYGGNSAYFLSANVTQRGLAIWLDHTPFNPATPNSNLWTPALLSDVANLMADYVEWIWLYTQNYSFNNGDFITAYTDVLETVRNRHGL